MKFRKHIIILITMLGAWSSVVLGQDYLNVVCAGDTGVDYSVSGTSGSTFNWMVEGGTITRNFNDSIIVDWPDESGEYEISVQEVSEYGCSGVLKTARVLVTAPDFDLGDDTFICEGEAFSLEIEGDFESYLWGDGSTGPDFETSEEGLISLTVTDEGGCTTRDEMYLEVREVPEVNLGEDLALCGEQTASLDAGSDGMNYTWSTGDISSEITVYQGSQEIWVTVENVNGCTNSDTVVIEDCDPNEYFSDIPTAITPSNQDGVNDVWRIEKLQAFSDAVVDIYDRWGRLIWRSEPGYPTPWDGKDLRGKPVPMDSYHFIILLNFGDDDRVVGSVTVIR